VYLTRAASPWLFSSVEIRLAQASVARALLSHCDQEGTPLLRFLEPAPLVV
jgi:hypothetical protein